MIMAMGRRKKRVRQEGLWTPTAAQPVSASHPFYQRLNQILDEKKFDEYWKRSARSSTPEKWAGRGWLQGFIFGC
jgi:hypothetical protein